MPPEERDLQAEGTASGQALRWEDTCFNPGAALQRKSAVGDMSDLPGDRSRRALEALEGLWLLI